MVDGDKCYGRTIKQGKQIPKGGAYNEVFREGFPKKVISI